MKVVFLLKIAIMIYISGFSISSYAQYYVLYSYLKPQNIIRVFSIVRFQRLSAPNTLTATFYPIEHHCPHQPQDQDRRLHSIFRQLTNPEPGRRAPVVLEVSGNRDRPTFSHGGNIGSCLFMEGGFSDSPILTEYIARGDGGGHKYCSNHHKYHQRSSKQNILSMLGIYFSIKGEYPGGSENMSLLGLHASNYPHVDITIPEAESNIEELLQSESQVLYPAPEEQTMANGQQHEIGHLMAYFTNQGNNDGFSLTYHPQFSSYLGNLRNTYFMIMTPIALFRLLIMSSGSRSKSQ